ncbi:hypothetical protein GSH05_07480 [Burkholderia pseudomallei]|uniref:hypothetical protein n=1 Tax=Burkholderia pseudomallei TaxID=28450 RepID=UPI000978B090|nr:hypothetical protein [Burkholderia pseudomallei]MBM5581741.1 hypothetical protein [Burkholderia pseudomallei]MBM5588336.1 hypothetical protein [Burkholderia pseudomallei]MBM5651506.1 hypothetical protein [Burkholderia pseudomallei]RPA00890.1 hypothetical protein EGT86_30170 [Burkholderia pseudomallei]
MRHTLLATLFVSRGHCRRPIRRADHERAVPGGTTKANTRATRGRPAPLPVRMRTKFNGKHATPCAKARFSMSTTRRHVYESLVRIGF